MTAPPPGVPLGSGLSGALRTIADGEPLAEWLAGEAQEIIPIGTRVIAAVDQTLMGWVFWEDGKPSDHRMVLVSSGEAPARLYYTPSSAPCRIFLPVAGLCVVLPVRGLSDHQQHFSQLL